MGIEKTLPENWKLVPLFEISELIRGVSYSKIDSSDEFINGYVPILRATNIQDDELIIEDELVFVPKDYVKVEQYLENGDIVICMSSGSKHLVGKAGQLNNDWEGSFGTFCSVIRPKSSVNDNFLGYYFLSREYREFIRAQSVGININNLKPSDFENLKIPVPRINEQNQIVSKIEELFSQLDAGVAGLKRTQAELKRYRASVLKAAFEGRLVPQDPNDEDPHILLSRFLESNELEQRIVRQIKTFDKSLALSTRPSLPKKWIWISFSELPLDISDGNYAGNYPKASEFVSEGVPFIRATNLAENYTLDLSDTRYITKDLHRKLRRGHLLENDILIVTRGSIGKLALVTNAFVDFNINAQLVRINAGKLFFPKFLLYVLASENCQNQINHLSTGTALRQLPVRQFRQIRVPLPAYSEQIRIAKEVDRHLSIIQQLDKSIDSQLIRSNNIRQSILAHAFKGRLLSKTVNNTSNDIDKFNANN